MKKLLTLILAVICCLGMVACGPKEDNSKTLDDAIAILNSLYKDTISTTEDFDLVGSVPVGDKTAKITWTVNVDSIKIVESQEKGFYTVDLPDTNETEIKYVLKATAKIGKDSKSKEFEITLPQYLFTAESVITIKQAIELGLSKAHNTYTESKYYVVGEITEVYNTQYGNMKLKDAEGNILTIYGTYSADGATRYDALETKPVAGDTVKIYGIVGQYNDVAQIKNGWIVEHTPGTGGQGGTDTPVTNDPDADTTLTIEQALTLGASKEHNTYTTGKYYVVGEITEVYNEQYGNMKIKDANGNILTIYGTYSADGETRYDALETKPVAGDTVKIYGVIGQYNGTPQVKNGWIVEVTPAA